MAEPTKGAKLISIVEGTSSPQAHSLVKKNVSPDTRLIVEAAPSIADTPPESDIPRTDEPPIYDSADPPPFEEEDSHPSVPPYRQSSTDDLGDPAATKLRSCIASSFPDLNHLINDSLAPRIAGATFPDGSGLEPGDGEKFEGYLKDMQKYLSEASVVLSQRQTNKMRGIREAEGEEYASEESLDELGERFANCMQMMKEILDWDGTVSDSDEEGDGEMSADDEEASGEKG